MIIGLLSDSHGRSRRVARAIQTLEQLGTEAFIHCGDVGESVLEEFAGRTLWFVWGNTDPQGASAIRYARRLGLQPPSEVPTRVRADERTIAVFHGHEAAFEHLTRLLRRGEFEEFARRTEGLDYLLYGHSHIASDQRIGHTRVINPGALERAFPYTVATLDLARDELRFWQVDENAPPDAAPLPYTFAR